jgi:hypothetical protein
VAPIRRASRVRGRRTCVVIIITVSMSPFAIMARSSLRPPLAPMSMEAAARISARRASAMRRSA